MNKAWIPNSITMGNLLFGFLSIVFASQGDVEHSRFFAMAGLSIMVAALLDGCDGLVARALKVSSKLGAELDSLADCVTFGVAPGYLAYKAYLSDLTLRIPGGSSLSIGMFVAAIFPICAAYRLARFNVDHVPNSFSGLPSPIAGIIMALVPIAITDVSLVRDWLLIFIPGFIAVALLMVSTVRFAKPQTIVLQKIQGFKLVLLLVLCVALLVVFFNYIHFIAIGLLLLYVFSGLMSFVIQFIQDHKY